MELKNWIMNYEGYEDISCKAPCSLYSVLLENNLIDDPFIGLNEHKVTELSRKNCEFYTHFDIEDEMLKNEFLVLRFNGLDTLCQIYLNGRFLGKTKDMHRTYEFDVKEFVKKKDNVLKLFFENPMDYCDEMNKKHYLHSNPDSYKGCAHIRKASYMFGWDWGPVLPDMGIWRSVELLSYDVMIENVLIKQIHKENRVTLNIEIETAGNEKNCEYKVNIEGKDHIFNEKAFVINIENPKLWWPNGYGEQNLYNITFEVLKDGVALDKQEKTIGLRTLTVSRNKDKYGEEFCFEVNSVKIFAMGANYIPQDNILNRINRERTERLIKQCVKANYNTIRVWGGGYYPEDDFYDLCDRYGLIVWQDFMFACNNIWLREEFLEDIKKEAIDNVKRIRHHASLGLLCGNNEMEWGLEIWGVSTELVRADYLQWYEHILPDICAKYAPQTFYWQASPSSGGGFREPNNPDCGDVHYWEVWHGNKPFEDYRNYYFRFLSEFGFEAFPSMKTIEYFAKEQDMNMLGEVMENRQKCGVGTERILTYLSYNYLYPSDFENLVYASELLQADAIKYGVEHLRRFRGRCMGAVYWQVNDCWPGVSWSSIDYFGRWKALHYSAKKFFSPILISIHEDGFNTVFNISNETMEDFSGKVTIYVKDRDFNIVYSYENEVFINKLSALDIFEEDFTKYFEGNEKERYVECILTDKEGNIIMTQTLLYVKPKRFNFKKPKLNAEIKKEGRNIYITVRSDTFAKGVMVDFKNADLELSDNFFDITKPDGVTICADSDLQEEELLKNIMLKSVYDIR